LFSLLDRRGGLHALIQGPGDTVAVTLLRNAIPPASVLTFCDESVIVADDHIVDPARSYVAKLIEGYDITGIRRLFDSLDSSKPYVRRRLGLAADGRLSMERAALDVPGVADHVESTVWETIEQFRLVEPTDSVVLGLSGGVDSGSLLMLLAAYRDASAPNLKIQAVPSRTSTASGRRRLTSPCSWPTATRWYIRCLSQASQRKSSTSTAPWPRSSCT
jgi:hypothetical protein